jgi:hypothetical protein
MTVQSETIDDGTIACLLAKEGRSILGKPDPKCNPIPRQLPTFKLPNPQRRPEPALRLPKGAGSCCSMRAL